MMWDDVELAEIDTVCRATDTCFAAVVVQLEKPTRAWK